MKVIKKILLAFVAVSFPLIANAAVTLSNPIGYSTFPALFTAIADAAGTIIASLGALMVIVSGFLFMTSAGIPNKIQTAKSALTYAIIGIAVGLLAKAIADSVVSIIGG